jgi:hypothetical protein
MERKIRSLFLFIIALCALTSWANADEPLTIDLATMTPDGVTTRPGGRNVTYDKIIFINLIPRFVYNVDFALEDVGIPSLSVAGLSENRQMKRASYVRPSPVRKRSTP